MASPEDECDPAYPNNYVSDEVLHAAQAATAGLALITDAAQIITYVSPAFTAMTGYAPAEMIGMNCRILQGPGTDVDTRRQIREILAAGKTFEGQILNYRKDGSAFWTALKVIPMRVGTNNTVTHFVSVQRDVTNRVALLKQLESQALEDHVTGLPNRAAAEKALTEAVKRSIQQHRAVAIGLIDLDDFRTVNNTLGHAAGDSVLQQWSTRMLANLREGDVLARMGGDEFLLILRNIARANSASDLSDILDRAHGAVDEPFTFEGREIHLGMSLGLALVPEDGTDSQSILRSADEALYVAKRRDITGAQWWETAAHAHEFYAGPQPENTEPTDMEDSGSAKYLAALNGGSALIHLQPVVNLRDGSVDFFEALARLQLPSGRVVYPDEFLPHLGTNEQRVLFIAVLDQALDAIVSWELGGAKHSVAVNLPPEILHGGTVPALVEGSLSAHQLPPARLRLELLESQSMGLESQRAALQELADLGIGLAMDDLGSGYSSLQRLSSFPFSAIKLDRGLFLSTYEKPLETLSIMATLIQMGRDLGMEVVIEGLEDESLTEAAIILGAPLGQGYYFAKPLPPGECVQWLAAFEFQSHKSPLQTPLGALAYHWQFARISTPHPLELERCPLTRFIRNEAPSPEAASWHAYQHIQQEVHPVSSRFLIDWLAQLIR